MNDFNSEDGVSEVTIYEWIKALSSIENRGSLTPAEIAEIQKENLCLPHLKELTFIQDKQNVLLIGSSGTGKTHLAIGLGIEACLAGYKVYFTSVASLVIQLKESRSARTLRSFELKFEKYDVVIIDELGCISFDKEGAELLFTHLSLRVGRAATIITSNLTFEPWEEVFHDPVLTSALTGRLTHRAHIINMIGESYRILETKEWREQSNF